jgi:prepilin-type N-terminal cleavage/methylation domain-containing protein
MYPTMSSPRCLFRSARSRSGKGGFTLVELLVVIAIIAILAGVAFGPITQGLEKAKESAGMQTARTIALSMFQYQVDNSNFPGGNKSQDVATALVQGGYITDPSIFAKDKSHAYAGTTASITSMPASAICWDFFVESSQNTSVTPPVYYGLSTSDPDGMPAVFSTGQVVTPPTQGPSNTPLAVNSAGTNPFGSNGMAICYKSNSAVFLKAINNGSGFVVNTTSANEIFNASFSCTPGNFVQITPQ